MEEYTYVFRHKAPWGIWIKIKCTMYEKLIYTGQLIPIAPCLSLAFKEGWLENNLIASEDIENFKSGLAMIAPELCKQTSQDLVIQVNYIEYNPTDFQSEGLGYAIAKWLDQKFALDFTFPDVWFDPESNRYIFPY